MTVKPSIQTGRKAMAPATPHAPHRNPQARKTVTGEALFAETAAEDDWLRELFAAIPDLRDADVGRDRRAAGG